MPQWTPEQQAAIEAQNNELLISAAAGSGKTAVLIERIMRLIRFGGRIDRMVIVTFTKAAAAQLRERLQKKLSEEAEKNDAFAREQLALLPVTQIGTIHSFCASILKEYFHVVGMDPGAAQADDARRAKLFNAAMEQALDELAENPTADYGALSAAFSDADIADMAAGLYQFMMSLKEPFEWLESKTHETYTAQSLKTHPFTKVLLNNCRVCLNGLDAERAAYGDALREPDAHSKWLPIVASDTALFEKLKNAKGLDELISLFDTPFMRAPVIPKLEGAQKEWHEEMKARRKRFKDALNKARDMLPGDLERDARDLSAMQPHLRGLKDLVKALHLHFTRIKQDENVLDFDDLIHLTLAVLKDPDARAALQQKYDHLFVDEYQDVGGAEEGIFQAIHHEGNHLFMVGDVKQSIYRFRLCDPTLFLSKQESFSLEKTAAQRKIFLNRNFRSEPHVLASVNTVFEALMKKAVTELDYDEAAHLYPGRETGMQAQTELHVLASESFVIQDGDKPDKLDGEFQLVAELILKQMQEKIFDSRRGLLRPTQFRDMAILLPKARDVALKLQEALKKQGIPAFADSDESYFDLPEIRRMTALLQVLDNPRQDTAFLAVLKLPLFHFSDEEMADVRLLTPNPQTPYYDAFVSAEKGGGPLNLKCRETLEKLDEWRFCANHTALDTLVWDLMKASGLYLTAGAQKGGAVRQANLRLLCQYAADYQAVGQGGLNGFLRLSTQIGGRGDSKTAKEMSPRDDLVRIMTIHKSKGLEFPIVYLMGLGGSLHLSDRRKLRPHKELGIGIPYVDSEKRITRKTLSQRAISAINELEDKAERARLLYVGMTRAEEKLVMLGTVEKLPRENFQLTGEYGIYAAKTYLDWLIQVPECYPRLVNSLSTGYPQPGNPYSISVCDIVEKRAVENADKVSTALSALLDPVDPLDVENIQKRFARAAAPQWPLKTSVSALAQNMPFLLLEESVETKAAGEASLPPLSMHDLPDSPAFLKPRALSAADRGSAVHLALSKLDYAQAISAQLAAMAQKGLLTPEQLQAVPEKWLHAFQNSVLCRRMRSSPLVKREWAFNLKLFPDRETLVQGVIDLCFLEEKGWVLCDYKTDLECGADVLLPRYGEQVRLYRQALERITKKPVYQAWLFALRTGESIQVI